MIDAEYQGNHYAEQAMVIEIDIVNGTKKSWRNF